MKRVYAIVFLCLTFGAVDAFACTPGSYRSTYTPRQPNACFDWKQATKCSMPVRVYYCDGCSEAFDVAKLVPDYVVVGEDWMGQPPELNFYECYPESCPGVAVAVVGPLDVEIDADYKTNPQLTVYVYDYEIYGSEPCCEAYDYQCKNSLQRRRKINGGNMQPQEDSGCSVSTTEASFGWCGIALCLLIFVRRRWRKGL